MFAGFWLRLCFLSFTHYLLSNKVCMPCKYDVTIILSIIKSLYLDSYLKSITLFKSDKW